MSVWQQCLKNSSPEWMGGWMDGWMDVKVWLRIAYSNKKCLNTTNTVF